MITLSTMIFILLIDYIFTCIEHGQILQYMEITLRQIGVISVFVGMIYFAINYSSKREIISYFFPVLIWYLIDTTILSLAVFSNVIVKIPNSLFIILLVVGIVVIILCLYKHKSTILDNDIVKMKKNEWFIKIVLIIFISILFLKILISHFYCMEFQ